MLLHGFSMIAQNFFVAWQADTLSQINQENYL